MATRPIEIPEELYELIMDCAAAQDTTPEQYVIDSLRRTTEVDVSEMFYDTGADVFKHPGE